MLKNSFRTIAFVLKNGLYFLFTVHIIISRACRVTASHVKV